MPKVTDKLWFCAPTLPPGWGLSGIRPIFAPHESIDVAIKVTANSPPLERSDLMRGLVPSIGAETSCWPAGAHPLVAFAGLAFRGLVRPPGSTVASASFSRTMRFLLGQAGANGTSPVR